MNNNPYIAAYLQSQGSNANTYTTQFQLRCSVSNSAPQERRDYTPCYSMSNSAPQPPRQTTQFPTQPPQQNQYGSYNSTESLTGLNVFDQGVLKQTLEAEKVNKVGKKAFESHLSSAQKTREEIDRELHASKANATAPPPTIKVEKKPIDDLNNIASRRDQEFNQIKVEKKPDALLGTLEVKKTDPNKLNRDMDDLIKRRQMELQNIKYK
jgi:hypothetical protein